jgi:UDP-MurNAc hydroxylase
VVPVPRQPRPRLGALRQADFLYISHRHRDHFDPALLERYVPKDIRVLLPAYPTDDLEVDLRALGYDNIVYTQPGEVSSTGLKIMVTPLRAERRPDRRLVAVGRRRHGVDPEPERLAPLDLEKLLSSRSPTRTSRRSPARSGGRWSTTCRRRRSRTSRS